MTEEAFIRIACTAMATVGVAILAATLGGQFGTWAAGAVLLVVGLAVAWPMWMKHLDEASVRRDMPKPREIPAEDDLKF